MRGQTVTEAASVEEADAWCVAAGDVGRATGETFVRCYTPNSASPFTENRSAKPSQSVEYIYSYLLTIYFHRINKYETPKNAEIKFYLGYIEHDLRPRSHPI